MFVTVAGGFWVKRVWHAAEMPGKKAPLRFVGLGVHPLNCRAHIFSNPSAADVHYQYIVHKTLTAQHARYLRTRCFDRCLKTQTDLWVMVDPTQVITLLQLDRDLCRAAKAKAAPDHIVKVGYGHVREFFEQQRQHHIGHCAARDMTSLTEMRPVAKGLM